VACNPQTRQPHRPLTTKFFASNNSKHSQRGYVKRFLNIRRESRLSIEDQEIIMSSEFVFLVILFILMNAIKRLRE
jgi:hypothetical protein